jgi:type III restriction enzyme
LERFSLDSAFVKNAGLGFAVPYLHNGQMHDYMPDFIIRRKGDSPVHVVWKPKATTLLKA